MQKLRRRRPPAELRPETTIRFNHGPSAPGEKLLEQPLRLHLHIEHAARRQLRLATGEIRLERGEASRGPFTAGLKRQQMHDPAGEDAVIADKVDHFQPRLARGRPEAAAELLQENNLRLRRPEHHDAIDERQIDPLVEKIDRAQGRQTSFLKGGQGGHPRVATVARKHGRRGHAALSQPIAGKERMPPRATKQERAAGRNGLPFGPEPVHASAVFESDLELADIEATAAPWDLGRVVIDVVLQPPIPKRHERLLRDPLPDRRLVGKDVVKERRDIDAIGPLGRGREAEGERSVVPRQLRKDAPVARRLRVMDLVDHAKVEGGGRSEGRQPFWPRELLDRGDDELTGEVARRSGDRGDARWGERLPHRRLRLGEDLRPVGDHEHPRRPAEGLAMGNRIKGREPGFPQPRRHGNESL